MSTNDEVDELFGDDDDVVVSKKVQEATPVSQSKLSAAQKEDEADEVDELFGDDDDDNDNTAGDRVEADDGEDDGHKLGRVDYAQGKPVSVDVRNIERFDDDAEFIQVVLPAVIAYDSKEFEEEDFDNHVAAFKETLGATRAAVTQGYQNVIRYRRKEDGTLESNARLVEWADGTKQVQIGSEYFNLSSTALPLRDPQLLACQTDGVYQSQGVFTKKSSWSTGNNVGKARTALKRVVDQFTQQESSRGTVISDEISNTAALLEQARQKNKLLEQEMRRGRQQRQTDLYSGHLTSEMNDFDDDDDVEGDVHSDDDDEEEISVKRSKFQ